MFGHSISTKRQFLFCLLMKCPNIITSAHFEPLVNCIHTHTHSHATDDFHGPNTVHKCHLLLVCFGYEVSHVGVNLSAFPGEIRFIIDHQLRIKTTTRHIRHTPIHTHNTYHTQYMCHVPFVPRLYFSVRVSYFRLVGSLHSRFSLNHKRNSMNSVLQQDSHSSRVLQHDTLTILRGCREPT